LRQFKAVVIGTGAGGAPAASRLAQAWGDGVAMVEAGRNVRASEFNQLERDMVPKLYVQGGAQATEDGAVGLLQGRCVGGTTVINDALCFRPPPETEDRWLAHGAKLDLNALTPYVDEVDRAMGVQTIAREMHNRANYLVGLGAARLGWRGERLRHNSPTCVECGFRHLGCAYSAKQSMNLTFVPQAMAAGAQLIDETKVHHLVSEGAGWRVITDQGDLVADHVVICAGVVQTPTLLLRSGIPAGEGVQLHLSTVAWGDFEEPVDAYAGIPMSYGVLEFADVFGATGPGYLIEGVGVQALSFSVQPQVMSDEHEVFLARFRHLAGALCLVRSNARGRVRLKGDRPAVDYPLVAEDASRMVHFYNRATELFMAAGAQRVALAHRDVPWTMKPPGELVVEAGRQYTYAAHLFGGANRGGPVVDEVGRVRGQSNLWVLDASAFPEALGVNPQITIASLALEGADRLLAEAQ